MPELRRELTLFDMTMIAIGSTIGSGIFLTPLFFVTISSLFVVYTFFEKPAEAMAGLGFLAVGVPVYFMWKKKNPKSVPPRSMRATSS
jgi:amino acid permease